MKESSYVLGLIKDLHDHDGTSATLEALEKFAVAKQHPTELMKNTFEARMDGAHAVRQQCDSESVAANPPRAVYD